MTERRDTSEPRDLLESRASRGGPAVTASMGSMGREHLMDCQDLRGLRATRALTADLEPRVRLARLDLRDPWGRMASRVSPACLV